MPLMVLKYSVQNLRRKRKRILQLFVPEQYMGTGNFKLFCVEPPGRVKDVHGQQGLAVIVKQAGNAHHAQIIPLHAQIPGERHGKNSDIDAVPVRIVPQPFQIRQ